MVLRYSKGTQRAQAPVALLFPIIITKTLFVIVIAVMLSLKILPTSLGQGGRPRTLS
jgi:hypothetical protein